MKIKVLDDKVKDEIVLAAAKVFETYGLNKVSMQDISEASGKGRSSLYYYFKSKTEVFDALAEKTITEIFNACIKGVSKEASWTQNIEEFQVRKLTEMRLMTKKYHLAFLDLRQDPATLVEKLRFLLNEEIGFFHTMLNWAIEKKEIRQLSAEDSKFLAETLVVAMRGFEQEILLFDRFPDFEQKLNWMVQIFWKGLQ